MAQAPTIALPRLRTMARLRTMVHVRTIAITMNLVTTDTANLDTLSPVDIELGTDASAAGLCKMVSANRTGAIKAAANHEVGLKLRP
jgi:hypothetical protein